MSNDLLDILSGNQLPIDNQKLEDYLNGRLSEKERQELEQQIADSDFMNDAVEGLEKIREKKNIHSYVEQLNHQLQNHLQKKKQRRSKMRIKEYPWIYLAVIVLLAICITAYFVIRMYLPAHHS